MLAVGFAALGTGANAQGSGRTVDSDDARTAEEPTAGARESDTESDATRFTCGTKRYCGQMNSCREARFHFQQCGLDRLDGDNDGIPCESLCR